MELKTQTPSNLIPAGKLSDYALNKFRLIETGATSIGVVRTKHGIFAVRNQCPHMGAPICLGSDASITTLPSDTPFKFALDTEHEVVRCPLHRWEFHLDTGKNVGGATKAKVRTYRVELQGDEVFIVRGAASEQQVESLDSIEKA